MASQIPLLLLADPKKVGWVWAEILLKLYWSQSFQTVLVICAVDCVSLICILELDLLWILFPNPYTRWSWYICRVHPSILYGLTSQWRLLTVPLIAFSF